MTTQIAGSVLSNVGEYVRSADFTVSSGTFVITCSAGAVRLLIKIGGTYYGLGDVYQAQDYPTGGISKAPKVPLGNALPVVTLTGETYALEALEPATTASAWAL